MLCQTPESINLIDSSSVNSHISPGAKEFLFLLPFHKEGSLQDLLDNHRTINGKDFSKGVFSEHHTLVIFRQICEAISLFHHHDPPLAHRDIKPGNILLTEDKVPILMDFGSTREARTIVKSRKQALEIQDDADQNTTPFYRAPELFDVLSDCTIDESTDIWALGCLLHTIAYNRSPFESSSEESNGSVALAVISGLPKNFPNNDYSNNFTQLIRKMVNLNKQERPSIDQVLKDIDSMLSTNY
eukprot:gene4683-5849_t